MDGGLLEDFLSKGYTPVVATIAQGAEDPTQVYSVSANHTAAKLAVALKAEKLIHLVAAEQLLHTPESPDAPIPVLPLSQVPALIRNGTIPADMAGKVNFSVEAVRSGVKIRHPAGRERPPRHSAGAAVRRGHRHHADPLRRGDRR